MFLVREIMHCKPGKVGELVKRFKQMEPLMKELGAAGPVRIMTDMGAASRSGPLCWSRKRRTSTSISTPCANPRAIRGCRS